MSHAKISLIIGTRLYEPDDDHASGDDGGRVMKEISAHPYELVVVYADRKEQLHLSWSEIESGVREALRQVLVEALRCQGSISAIGF